jgi:hypothetical protein
MKYTLGQALVVAKSHSLIRGSATSTWQSVEYLTPAEPLKFLINSMTMKTMKDTEFLSISVVHLYLMMH